MADIDDSQDIISPIKARALVLALFMGTIVMVSTMDLLLGLGLRRYGVQPREVVGLSGLVFAPWVHGSFAHLFANVGALAVLGWFCLWPRISRFVLVTAGAMLGAGLLAWLFGGSRTVHLGASGIIFGYFGFLALRGWYERTVPALLVSSVTIFLYGGMIFGVLPSQPAVSWQSHLGGFLAGALMARLLKTSSTEKPTTADR
ncbi:MAG: Rhomboid family protein [Betaproteobacteria bacterium ADurb.Bin341]|nr:MAG: Rhomboid family protein [Betaproteobacteria bacterium ADurb.Bin341]